MSWHSKTAVEVINHFNSNEHGLTKIEVENRFKKYGQNKLPESKTDNVFTIFLRQFQSPLIYILLAAALAVFLMGDVTDAVVIFVVLFFNAIVGALQEGRAQNTLLALKKFTETTCTVLRDGKDLLVRDTELVPGDIILLQEGEKIPADARIIFQNTLKIDEASLTGESEPVSKTEAVLSTQNIAIVEQRNMVFKGTHVLSGSGTAIVVATGISTEIGKIAERISVIDTEIPLKKNIKYLSRLVIVVVFIVSLLLILTGVLLGKEIKEMFSVTVALAVSIIPEGLPIVMTLVLATGVRRMSKHNVLVKRLQAVEALGQTKIIAVDKTGTLTKNEMIIQKLFVEGKTFEVTGNGYEPKGEFILNGKVVDPLNHPELILSGKISGFCANARLSFVRETNTWKVSGDPTEVAMLSLSEKMGFFHDVLDAESPKIFEISFDHHKKYHATVRKIENKNFLSVIGAPEKVLDLCTHFLEAGEAQVLNEDKRKELENVFYDLAKGGLRVVAYAMNPETEENFGLENMPPLTFVGFLGMRDALRHEVRDAVERVRLAGMKLVMITGDHRLTAESIGREAGIYRDGDSILTGEEIDRMGEGDLIKKLQNVTIFARVTPEHKFKIIESFRKRGEVVAMTGDGVNDAPSLVAADLGVAMGKIGTEVAKEASDIILLDDNFEGIVRAAEEGRGIYKTIKKVILYLFSTSIAELIVIVVAVFSGYPLLFLATQIIWLNFVTDGFLVVALAMEPKEHNLLRGNFEKPKKWIVDGLMIKRMFPMALVMALGTLYVFIKESEFNPIKVQTIALTTLAAFQWFNAWNCRSENKSILQMNPFSNMYLVGATFIVIILQILALSNGFLQKILHTVPLSLSDWIMIVPITASVVLVEEIRKLIFRLRKQ